MFSPIIGGIADQHGERVAFVILGCLVVTGGIIAMSVRKFVEADVANVQNA